MARSQILLFCEQYRTELNDVCVITNGNERKVPVILADCRFQRHEHAETASREGKQVIPSDVVDRDAWT
uniref:Uncharacterized protein n=1 Tax=Agrobacterium tumefaciens TaxID=358 RepID=A0A2Z2Q4W6_AGRTU|nr:hypothetical protein [Agrobacterium radiobacter]